MIPDSLDTILKDHARSALAPEVTLLKLMLAAESTESARAVLDKIAKDAQAPHAQPRSALARLVQENPNIFEIVAAITDTIESGWRDAAHPWERLSRLAEAFDRCARLSPAASVALYSFGEESRLSAATTEITTYLRALGVLGKERKLLDIGCGIGRLEAEIAPDVGSIIGVDISPVMVSLAKQRCARFDNVDIRKTAGVDLSDLGEASFDTVLAIDSFPYLLDCGSGIVASHFAGAGRLLKKNGSLIIMNFSYRDDLDVDRAEVSSLAAQASFRLLRNGDRPFKSWDGAVFHLA